MNAMLTKSNRILIRPWQSEDAKQWLHLSQDEGLNRFSISGYRQSSLEEAQAFVQKWQNVFNRNKLGVFPVFYKDLTTMMGVVGLKEVSFDGKTEKHIELMYRFAHPYWGKGLATEAAHGLLRYAFFKLKLKQVIAFIEKENQASFAVLQRLGFSFAKEEAFHQHPVQVYKITKQDFIKESSLEYRKLKMDETAIAQSFYNQVEYRKPIKDDDIIFGAFDNQSMVGAVRFEIENGVRILRGMQIHYKHAGHGAGKKLLKLLESELGQDVCYCIPFSWLESFYSVIGFKKIDLQFAPHFLQERLKENPQTIIMKRDHFTS